MNFVNTSTPCQCQVPFTQPKIENVCVDQTGKDITHKIEGFYGIGSHDGKGIAEQLCQQMGGSDDIPEWAYEGASSETGYYDSRDPHSGCSIPESGDCVKGSAALCYKTPDFTGKIGICCINDYDCDSRKSQSDIPCFDNIYKQNMCNPINRNIQTSACQESAREYLLGIKDEINAPPWTGDWKTRWDAKSRRAIAKVLYGCNLDRSTISSAGLRWGKGLMSTAFQQYAGEGFSIMANPGEPGYSDFQNDLFQICLENPMICNDTLNLICSAETLDKISRQPSRMRWCGCYLPPTEYEKYLSIYQLPGIECTPPCNQNWVVPLATKAENAIVECETSTCIIDNITINLVNSITGGISIDQVCGSCGGEGNVCNCLIENDTIDVIDSKIEGKISFRQSCGTIETVDEENRLKEIEQQQIAAQKQQDWIWVFVIIAIISLIIVSWLVTRRQK